MDEPNGLLAKDVREIRSDFSRVASSYVNWVTSIAIANLVFLVRTQAEGGMSQFHNFLLLQIKDATLRQAGFFLTIAALVLMFIFRTLELMANYCRREIVSLKSPENIKRTDRLKKWEVAFEYPRAYLFIFFMFLFVAMICVSFVNINSFIVSK